MNMRYNFACALTVSKETEAAIEILGPVFETAFINRLNHAKVDPDLDPLRGDPCFKAMIAAAEARLGAAAARVAATGDGGAAQAS
jgi:adenylate cyclase